MVFVIAEVRVFIIMGVIIAVFLLQWFKGTVVKCIMPCMHKILRRSQWSVS